MISVLFSGGIDSWACLLWAVTKFGKENVRPVYYNYGQKCAQIEIASAIKLCLRLELMLDIVLLPGMKEDVATGHVPMRNLTFIMQEAAREDCDGIVLGMLKGEASEDKNPKFVRRVQTLIASQFEKSIYRSQGKYFHLYVPFARKTKAQVVKWLMCYPPFAFSVFDTVGCYSAKEGGCGLCMSCQNRWIAFELNNLSLEFSGQHPFFSLVDYLLGVRPWPVQETKMTPYMVLWLILSFPSRCRKYLEIVVASCKFLARWIEERSEEISQQS